MSFKLVPFESLGSVSYSPSIVTIALSCVISESKRDIGRKSWYFHTLLHSTPPLGGSPSEYCRPVWYGNTRMVRPPDGKKFEHTFSGVYRISACDRRTDVQTDGQTSCDGIVRAMRMRRAVKTIVAVGKYLPFVIHFRLYTQCFYFVTYMLCLCNHETNFWVCDCHRPSQKTFEFRL